MVGAPDSTSSGASNPTVTQDDTNPSEEVPMEIEHDMAVILRNWESPGREKPHEPFAQQIRMEEAIAIGEAELASHGTQGFIPIDLLSIDKTKTTAYLSQNLPPNQDGQFLAPIYSYWTVTLKGETMDVTLIINAVTGEMWNIDMQINPYQNTDIPFELGAGDAMKMLSEFLDDISISSNVTMGVDSNPTSSPPSISAFQELDGSVFAIASIKGRRSHESDDENILLAPIGINIYLSSDAP